MRPNVLAFTRLGKDGKVLQPCAVDLHGSQVDMSRSDADCAGAPQRESEAPGAIGCRIDKKSVRQEEPNRHLCGGLLLRLSVGNRACDVLGHGALPACNLFDSLYRMRPFFEIFLPVAGCRAGRLLYGTVGCAQYRPRKVSEILHLSSASSY